MNKEQLLELATRCEREDPSPKLNEAIALAMRFNFMSLPDDASAADVPRYTTSLDAAVTLVLEDTDWQVGRVGSESVAGIYPVARHPFATHKATAATPALALCAAALKARAAIAEKPAP